VPEPKSIFIINEHAMVRHSLKTYLSSVSEFDVIGEVKYGKCAIDLIMYYLPDVVLMDLITPFRIGIDAVHQIKGISPRTKVVVLISTQDDETILAVLVAGANECLVKDVRTRILTGAIQRALNNEPRFHPRIAALILVKMDPSRLDSISTLSEQESFVLRRIAMGFSNNMISNELSISERMVIGFQSNILHKLHLAGRVEAALNA
jgi:DNA-binding NarL/FixJ family response regulator